MVKSKAITMKDMKYMKESQGQNHCMVAVLLHALHVLHGRNKAATVRRMRRGSSGRGVCVVFFLMSLCLMVKSKAITMKDMKYMKESQGQKHCMVVLLLHVLHGKKTEAGRRVRGMRRRWWVTGFSSQAPVPPW